MLDWHFYFESKATRECFERNLRHKFSRLETKVHSRGVNLTITNLLIVFLYKKFSLSTALINLDSCRRKFIKNVGLSHPRPQGAFSLQIGRAEKTAQSMREGKQDLRTRMDLSKRGLTENFLVLEINANLRIYGIKSFTDHLKY